MGKLQIWYRHSRKQISSSLTYSGLFFLTHASSFLSSSSVQYLTPILHTHPAERYTPQVSLFQVAQLSFKLSSFIPIIFVRFLQHNTVAPSLSSANLSYTTVSVPICFPKPAWTAYTRSLHQGSSFPHLTLVRSTFRREYL